MPSVIPYLVLQGASLTVKDHNGCTPLDYALLGFTPATVVFLKSKNAPQGTNTLINAINQNDIPALEKALKDGANPNLAVDQDPLLTLLTCSTTESSLHIAELLLKAGADVNLPDAFGHTPLMNADQENNVNMAKLLIAHGANVNIQNATGFTSLMYAVQTGNLPIVKLLLAPPINAKTTPQANQAHYLDTALLIATSGQTLSLDLVKALLKADDIKDSIDMQDNGGYTALMWTVQAGNLPIIQLLLAAGARTTPQANQANGSDTALIVSLNQQTPSLAIAKALLEAHDIKDSINIQDNTGSTALMYAVMSNNLPLTLLLIAAGAKTTPQANKANYLDTALLVAINQQTLSLPIIEALLNAPDIKDSINLQDTTGMTALMLAANRGNLPITKALLAAGANPVITTFQGKTAWSFAAPNCRSILQTPPSVKANSDLFTAVINNDLPGVKKALAAGANPSYAVGISGTTTTMLILAISENHTAIAEALIAAKANVNFKDDRDATALIYAAYDGNLELVNALLAAGANPNFQTNAANGSTTALITATADNFTSVVEALAKVPTISQSINTQDNTGATALIYAAQAGNEALVKVLASIKGINANLQDNTGMTALMYAAQGNSLPLLQLLVKIPRISLNLQNMQNNNQVMSTVAGPGATAFDFATNQNCINFLAKIGAISSLNLPIASGITAGN